MKQTQIFDQKGFHWHTLPI